MSKVKCKSCGSWMNDTAYECPICDAENKNRKEIFGKPKTIVELDDWKNKNKNKLKYSTKENESIGKNNDFGVYKDGNDFITYGLDRYEQKTIIYKGDDEDYAVSLAYLRLNEDMVAQNTLVDFEENQLIKSNPYKTLSIYMFILIVELIALYYVLIVPFDYYFLRWFVF